DPANPARETQDDAEESEDEDDGRRRAVARHPQQPKPEQVSDHASADNSQDRMFELSFVPGTDRGLQLPGPVKKGGDGGPAEKENAEARLLGRRQPGPGGHERARGDEPEREPAG